MSHCPPLSEQPTTSKPNAYLGYVPETTPASPVAMATNERSGDNFVAANANQHYVGISDNQPDLPAALNVPYMIGREEIANTPVTSGIKPNLLKSRVTESPPVIDAVPSFDPVQQGQQINKLASEIEELRTRIDQLSSQNQLLLNQQFNKSASVEPKDQQTELRRP